MKHAKAVSTDRLIDLAADAYEASKSSRVRGDAKAANRFASKANELQAEVRKRLR